MSPDLLYSLAHITCAACRSTRLSPLPDPPGHPIRWNLAYAGPIRYACADCAVITSVCACSFCRTPRANLPALPGLSHELARLDVEHELAKARRAPHEAPSAPDEPPPSSLPDPRVRRARHP